VVILLSQYLLYKPIFYDSHLSHNTSVKIEEGGLDLFYFTFHFHFHSVLFFYFLFLEQLGLGLIGHAVTSIT